MGKNAEKQRSLEQKASCSKKLLNKGRFSSFYQETVVYPTGLQKTWDFLSHPGGVAIIAVNEKEQLLLVEQWRRSIGKIVLEIPAGLLEENENPQDCAQRELQEETGFKALSLTPWGEYYVSPGFSNEKIYLFFAQNLVYEPLWSEDTDQIDLLYFSKDELRKKLYTDSFCDAKTMIGVLRWLGG